MPVATHKGLFFSSDPFLTELAIMGGGLWEWTLWVENWVEDGEEVDYGWRIETGMDAMGAGRRGNGFYGWRTER